MRIIYLAHSSVDMHKPVIKSKLINSKSNMHNVRIWAKGFHPATVRAKKHLKMV